jgi:HSP20 family protein
MNTCQYPTDNALSRENPETIHRPQYRVTENDQGTQVQIALPGVKRDDLKLTLLQGSLQIEARRDQETPQDWKTHGEVRPITHYGLSLRLASRLDGTQTTAALDAGILTLQVPLREEAKPRQIHVN